MRISDIDGSNETNGYVIPAESTLELSPEICYAIDVKNTNWNEPKLCWNVAMKINFTQGPNSYKNNKTKRSKHLEEFIYEQNKLTYSRSYGHDHYSCYFLTIVPIN